MNYLQETKSMTPDELYYFVKDCNSSAFIAELQREGQSSEEIQNLFKELTSKLLSENFPLPSGYIDLYQFTKDHKLLLNGNPNKP